MGIKVTVCVQPETREAPGTAGAGPPHARGGTDRDEICSLGLGLPKMGVTFLTVQKHAIKRPSFQENLLLVQLVLLCRARWGRGGWGTRGQVV